MEHVLADAVSDRDKQWDLAMRREIGDIKARAMSLSGRGNGEKRGHSERDPLSLVLLLFPGCTGCPLPS